MTEYEALMQKYAGIERQTVQSRGRLAVIGEQFIQGATRGAGSASPSSAIARSPQGTPFAFGVDEEGAVLVGFRMAFPLLGEPEPRLTAVYRVSLAESLHRPEAVVRINGRQPGVRVTLPAVRPNEQTQFTERFVDVTTEMMNKVARLAPRAA